ncbi:histone deacetylase [Actinocatenispora rupis]|uniref:Histone deacetylase n=1 Tax=Actinocatenispora rupis TaxID=519421 RepID=A0A8J3JFR7_9ACTN|nr:histone deacetylase [Actinocatenispora rupis]GID15849.1 hypothetical protein Aru02nite_67380 [Actinocatenispora rupis]
MPPDQVWYAAYGSNMLPDRLRCYLRGGRPPGGRRTYPGCRDGSDPADSAALRIDGGLYFAGESRAWTGGMAFLDHRLPESTPAAAYLLTVGQFSDVVAQEMHREPGTDLPLGEVLATGRARLGPGRYETLVRVGTRGGLPVLTFTSPGRADEQAWSRPAPAYLGMIAAGLHRTHGWSVGPIVDHLASLRGVRGRWTRPELHETVTARLRPAGTG